MPDHRHHSRLPFEASVRLECGGLTLEAVTRDLTMKGLLVALDEALPIDAICDVDIRLAGGTDELHLRGQARVVRVEDPDPETGLVHVGLCFEHLEDEAQSTLWRLLRYNRGGEAKATT